MWDQRRVQAVLLLTHVGLAVGLAATWLLGGRLNLLPVDGVLGWWVVAGFASGVVWRILWPWSVLAAVLLGPPTAVIGLSVLIVYSVELLGNLLKAARGSTFELPQPVPYRQDRHGSR